MGEIVYAEESYRIMGACFEVYKEKGCGFLEAVFQECLEIELGSQSIPYRAQPSLQLSYKAGLCVRLTRRTSFASKKSSWRSKLCPS